MKHSNSRTFQGLSRTSQGPYKPCLLIFRIFDWLQLLCGKTSTSRWKLRYVTDKTESSGFTQSSSCSLRCSVQWKKINLQCQTSEKFWDEPHKCIVVQQNGIQHFRNGGFKLVDETLHTQVSVFVEWLKLNAVEHVQYIGLWESESWQILTTEKPTHYINARSKQPWRSLNVSTAVLVKSHVSVPL